MLCLRAYVSVRRKRDEVQYEKLWNNSKSRIYITSNLFDSYQFSAKKNVSLLRFVIIFSQIKNALRFVGLQAVKSIVKRAILTIDWCIPCCFGFFSQPLVMSGWQSQYLGCVHNLASDRNMKMQILWCEKMSTFTVNMESTLHSIYLRCFQNK